MRHYLCAASCLLCKLYFSSASPRDGLLLCSCGPVRRGPGESWTRDNGQFTVGTTTNVAHFWTVGEPQGTVRYGHTHYKGNRTAGDHRTAADRDRDPGPTGSSRSHNKSEEARFT